MPINRRATPPSSQLKEQFSVFDSLSAWTDKGDTEVVEKKRKVRHLPQGGEYAYTALVEEQHEPHWCIDVESDKFDLLIGIVIVANAVVIGLETEFGRERLAFKICEHSFNAIFFFEACLRIRQYGCEYFKEPWNLFDISLVTIGALDLWILPLCSVMDGKGIVGNHLSVMRLLRIFRLLRVLRVIRLFRMFQQLFLIMQAFNKAFHVVALMGILVVILDYACAVVLTQGIGHQADMWGEDADTIRKWFGSIGASMCTLFQIMTLCDWEHIGPMLSRQFPTPLVYMTLVLYIMITSYTMKSLVTGIVSDSLYTAQQVFKRNKLMAMSEKRKEMTADLCSFLHELLEDEKDSWGRVNASHLKMVVRGDTELRLNLAKIGISIGESGIMDLIDKLSEDGERDVDLDFFASKLTNLQGQAEASALIDLKYELIMMQAKIERLNSKRFPDLPPLLTPKKSPKEEVQETARRNSLMAQTVSQTALPLGRQSSCLKGESSSKPAGKKTCQSVEVCGD